MCAFLDITQLTPKSKRGGGHLFLRKYLSQNLTLKSVPKPSVSNSTKKDFCSAKRKLANQIMFVQQLSGRGNKITEIVKNSNSAEWKAATGNVIIKGDFLSQCVPPPVLHTKLVD